MRKKKAYLASVLALVLLLTATQSSHAQKDFFGKWCSEQLDVGREKLQYTFLNKTGDKIAGFEIKIEPIDEGSCEAYIDVVRVTSDQEGGCGDWDLTEKDDWSNKDGNHDNKTPSESKCTQVWVDYKGVGYEIPDEYIASEHTKGKVIDEDKKFTVKIDLKAKISEDQKCRICINAFTSERRYIDVAMAFPETDFYVADTGDPNVYIIVGCGAAAMDVVSATMLAAEISTMTYTDDSGSVTFDEPSSTEEDEEQTTGPDQIAPVDVDETSMIMLDTELDFAGWKAACDHNLILVGGPVANIIVKQLVDEGLSAVDWATSPGECEYIREPYGGCDILIVAGEDRDATRSAAQELLDSL